MDTEAPRPATSERLRELLDLKNFAISRGYPVPDGTIEDISALESALASSPDQVSQKDLIKLDLLTRDLSTITYPVTVDNVASLLEGRGVTKFASWLLTIGLCAAMSGGALIGLINAGTESDHFFKVVLAICLGIVGAILYVMLPNGRLNTVAGLDQESVATNLMRVIIGGLLGFVIYIVKPDLLSVQKGSAAYGLLAPLIGGYSITLVIGILAKAITAVELTLGLDDKKTHVALRKK
jgi:hypothetical protein